jgi:bis(5'-nucleosyl)-tetraphosphatase (symmetrical)
MGAPSSSAIAALEDLHLDGIEDDEPQDLHATQLIQLSTLSHKYLPQPTATSSKLIIIGDVHGQLHELKSLLKAADFSRSRGDHVVFAGDMVSKGPDSPGVVDLAMSMGASGVRGNHEDQVLRMWRKMHKEHSSEENQDNEEEGDIDIASKKAADRAAAASLTTAQYKWLSRLPVILKVGQIPRHGEVVVVHAGLVPRVALEDQDPEAVMNMRTLLYEHSSSSDGESPSPQKHKDKKGHKKNRIGLPSEGRKGRSWSKVWNEVQSDLPEKQRMTVVYGHDAKTGLNVQEYTFGLDSGCVRGNQLSALVFAPDKHGRIRHEIVSVECKKPKKHHKADVDGEREAEGEYEEHANGELK